MNSITRNIIGFCIVCAFTVNSFRPITSTSRLMSRPTVTTLQSSTDSNNVSNGNHFQKKLDKMFKASMLAFFAAVQLANARPEGVNRPDLLPKELNVPLIDVANFLSKGQEKKIVGQIVDLQKVTGWKLRILCQR